MEELWFEKDKNLYSDRDYFQFSIGGINSLGAGNQFISGSIAWNKSLQSLHTHKVKGRITDIRDICTSNESVMVGHICFAHSSTGSLFDGVKEVLTMEGDEWIPAIVCAERFKAKNQLQSPSAIVYFRESHLAIPKEWFEKIAQPINIFGEIWPMSMAGRSCIMKARAASVILGTNRFY